MNKLTAFAAVGLLAGAAAAPDETDTVESLTSEEEVTAVRESIGRTNCEAPAIEKENVDLFEIDNAICEIGRYDIKLDGDYEIISMTRD